MLWQRLLDLGMPGQFVTCIKSVYDCNEGFLDLGGQTRLRVPIQKGVFQGCPLSPLLFNLYVSDMRASLLRLAPPLSLLDPSYRLGSPTLQYADDLVMLTATSLGMVALLEALTQYAHQKKLVINVDKTKGMAFFQPERADPLTGP